MKVSHLAPCPPSPAGAGAVYERAKADVAGVYGITSSGVSALRGEIEPC
jgi:hypothetical protein